MNNHDYESEFVKVGKSLSQLWGTFFSRKPKRIIRHLKNSLRDVRNKEFHPELFVRLTGTILIWRHATQVLYGPSPINVPERVRVKLLQHITRSFNYILIDSSSKDIEMLAYLRSELQPRKGFDNPLRELLELKILQFAVADSSKVIEYAPELLVWKTPEQIEVQWKFHHQRLTYLYRLRIPFSVFNSAFG